MLRVILLLPLAFMLIGCGGTASGPVTEKRLKEHLTSYGKALVTRGDEKLEARLKPMEDRLNRRIDDGKEELKSHVSEEAVKTREAVTAYGEPILQNQKDILARVTGYDGELKRIRETFTAPPPAPEGGPVGGGVADVEIESSINGVTVKYKGPPGQHADVERIIKEQQFQRERDREMLFLRGQVHHDRRRAEEMETRVTTLEYDLASAVTHLHVELSTLGSSFRERNVLFEARIKEIADRCGAVTVVFSPPIVVPPPSVIHSCQGRRIYYHPAKRCLHVWH